jgi:hypothetical protein
LAKPIGSVDPEFLEPDWLNERTFLVLLLGPVSTMPVTATERAEQEGIAALALFAPQQFNVEIGIALPFRWLSRGKH